MLSSGPASGASGRSRTAMVDRLTTAIVFWRSTATYQFERTSKAMPSAPSKAGDKTQIVGWRCSPFTTRMRTLVPWSVFATYTLPWLNSIPLAPTALNPARYYVGKVT
jgi:hypothetical protein